MSTSLAADRAAESFYMLFEALVRAGPTDLSLTDALGNTLLHYVAACKFAEDMPKSVGQLLSGNGKASGSALVALNHAGWAPQHCLVASIMAKGSGFGALTYQSSNGSFHREFFEQKKLGAVELLFSTRESLSVTTQPGGETLLHLMLPHASSSNTFGILEEAAAVCVNTPDANGVYPLHMLFCSEPCLSLTNCFSFLKLLQLGADPYVVEEKGSRMTIFHMAAANGKQQSLLRMVSLGFIRADNVDRWCVRDAGGKTPLHYLAITSLQKAITSSFSKQLEVFALLCKLAGTEACSIKVFLLILFLLFFKQKQKKG